MARCQFNSPDGHDVVFLEQYYFNKILLVQYNSTLGKVVGYTKRAKEVADDLNRDTRFIKHEIWKTELCKRNSHLFYNDSQDSGNFDDPRTKIDLKPMYIING